MMAQPSYAPSFVPVSVIGCQFTLPYATELIISRNSSGDHLITDVNNRIMFKVKPCNTSYHEQRVLLDDADKPIVLIREKIMTAHSGWNVFKGDSKANSDLIFSTKTPKITQSKTNVHVFLANNTKKDACDFKITGSWSKRSCSIHMGDSSMSIAQMRPSNPMFVTEKFMVTVNPNVDYAFVVTLIAIVDAMKSSSADGDATVEVIGAVAEGLLLGLAFS